jgi:DNA-binding IclR family transcriptional regulator
MSGGAAIAAPESEVRGGSATFGSLKVFERARRVLDVLEEQDVVTITELVERLGENRTTLVRICEALMSLGLVERAEERSRVAYRLGIETLYLGGLVKQRSRLRSMALPVLQKVAENTGDTAYLIVPGRSSGICLARKEGTFLVSSVLLAEGDALPYHQGGGSEAILAFLPADQREDLLQRLVSAEKQTALRQKIATIRSVGYALSLNEFIAETGALGAPVLGPHGEIVAGLSVGAIQSRFSEDRLPLITGVVIQGAYEISRLLGYTGGFPPIDSQEDNDAG